MESSLFLNSNQQLKTENACHFFRNSSAAEWDTISSEAWTASSEAWTASSCTPFQPELHLQSVLHLPRTQCRNAAISAANICNRGWCGNTLDKPLPPPLLQMCDTLRCKPVAGRNQFIRSIIGLVSTHLANWLVSNHTVPVIDLPQREVIVLIPLTRIDDKHPVAIINQRTIQAKDDAAPEQLPDKGCGFLAYVDLGFKPAPVARLFAIPVSKLRVGIEIATQCSAQANSWYVVVLMSNMSFRLQIFRYDVQC